MRTTPIPDKSHLHAIHLLQGLSQSELDEVYGHLHMRLFRQGDVVLSIEHRSKTVFFVHKGFVKICDEISLPDAKKPLSLLTFNIVGPGAALGELNTLDNAGHSANAIALDSVLCFMLENQQFDEYCAKMPRLASNYNRHLATLIRRQSQRYRVMMRQNLHGKLAWILLDLSKRFGVPQEDNTLLIPFPLTKTLLGELTFNSREVIGQTVKFFATHEAISLHSHYRIAVNAQVLAKYCPANLLEM